LEVKILTLAFVFFCLCAYDPHPDVSVPLDAGIPLATAAEIGIREQTAYKAYPKPQSQVMNKMEDFMEANAMTETPANETGEIDEEAEKIEGWLKNLTIEEKIGQLIICRLPGGATTVTGAVQDLYEKCHLGGFILFSENIQSIEQVQSLNSGLQAMADAAQSAGPAIPLFIGTDEEGGRVSRIGKLYSDTSRTAFSLGQTGDPDEVYKYMYATGEKLISLGINIDFAPVADIWSNNANTIIGNRAYGRDPETAALMTAAAVRGLKDAGVLSVVKHFPGHGDTAEDSHLSIAVYNYDKERFDQFESVPFTHGIAAGTDGVMAGHIAAPKLTLGEWPVLEWMEPWLTRGRLPAVFSARLLTDILRGEMGFDGLIITDALEMGALTSAFTDEQITLGAFLAGADILLIPRNPATAHETLLNAYHEGLFADERLELSIRRILRAKAGIYGYSATKP
jgi:beta-N-acetylhexosaminidase